MLLSVRPFRVDARPPVQLRRSNAAAITIENIGGPERSRTSDLRFRKPLLCHDESLYRGKLRF